MARIVVRQLPESRTVRVDDANLVGGLHFVDLARENDFACQLIGWGWRGNRILRNGGEGGGRKIEIRGRDDLLRRGGRGSKAGGRGRLKRGEQVRRRG